MQLLKQFGVALLFVFPAVLTHYYVSSDFDIRILWPSSGVALAVVLIGGRSYLWGIALGSLIAGVLHHHAGLQLLGMMLGNVAQAGVGYFLLQRTGQPTRELTTLQDYLRLIGLGGGVAVIAGAAIGAATIVLAGIAPANEFFNVAMHWWLGAVLGVVLIAPLLLVWWQMRHSLYLNWRRMEDFALIAVTLFVGQIVFLGLFSNYLSDTPKGYWMFLLVSWVALRLGARGATLALVIIAIQALLGANQGVGFFKHDIARAGLHNYWGYMMILSFVAMTITLYVGDIRRRLEELKLKDIALNTAANSMFITDASARILWANESFSRVTGYSQEEALGRNPRELVKSGKQDRAFYKRLWDTILAKKVWRGEIVNRRKDGTLYDEEMTISPLTNEEGEITHFVAVKQDITERKQFERALKESEAHFRKLFEQHSAVMLLIEPDSGTIVDANQAAADFYGYPLSVLHGMNLSRINTQSSEEIAKKRAQAVKGERRIFTFEHRLANGEVRIVEVMSAPMDYKGHPILFSIIHDITERKLAEDQIRNLAFYDTLTQLPNRRLLHDRLAQVMAASKRSKRYSALLVLDLDNFKPLNDTHGHSVGDQLLVEAANRLKASVREVDTVARFGGDEFVVVLDELDLDVEIARGHAQTLAEKIRYALSDSYYLSVLHEGESEAEKVEHHCSASIGVMMFLGQDVSQEEVFKCADLAMYEAKEAGRNQIRFFEGQGHGA